MARRDASENVPSVVVVVVALALAGGPWTGPADGARILAVETIGGKSHWNFMSAVLRALTDAGHGVTAFTPFPEGGRDNYAEVDTSGRTNIKVEHDLTELMDNFSRPVSMVNALTRFNRQFCDSAVLDGRLAEAVRREPGFDAIFVEPLALDCASHLAAAPGAPPVVYVLPNAMLTFAERPFTGHFSNPACVSHIFAGHAVPGTFAQRLANAGLLAYSVLRLKYDEWTWRRSDPRPYDRSPRVSPSIVFQNTHRITDAARPVPPNVVEVGGVHLKPAKSIPKDLLDFIEDSPHGVIYFTFGSTVKLSSLPKHIEKIFKEVLSRVPQKVLWKNEIEMDNMPKNVMIKKWFPQREILLHPKVNLFISHGGISGVYEAVDAGVPVLGFPLFYDQRRNLEHLVLAEMAITMDLLNFSEDMLFNAITELTNNETYVKNAKIASYRFKDRPMTPAQSIVYWTEYVIRHKGAPHLRSHAVNLTWYQYLLLDVIGAVLVLILLTLFITYKALKCTYLYIFKNRQINKFKTH